MKTTADILLRHHWFSREMTSEETSTEIHTDDVSLTQIWVVLLIGRATREICLSQ